MRSVSNFIIKDKKPLININQNISEALRLLNTIDIKTLFVVKSKGSKLIFCGTITDGDIRRFLIKKVNLEKKIKFVFKKNSKFLFIDDEDYKKKISLIYKRSLINYVPILDRNRNYLGYIKSEKILKNSKNEKLFDLFIMAGKKKKRLRPLTYDLPKPLIEVNGSSMLSRIINSTNEQNVDQIFISLYYKSELIKKYINKNFKDKKVTYLVEKKPMGTAGSLSMLKNLKSKENFLLMNADISTKVDFNSFYNFHIKNKSDLTICSSMYQMDVPYGVLENKGKKIYKFVEKPNFKFLINSGIYFINKKIIKMIKNNHHLNANELVLKAIQNKYKVLHYPMYEQWIDIGSKQDLNKAKEILQYL